MLSMQGVAEASVHATNTCLDITDIGTCKHNTLRVTPARLSVLCLARSKACNGTEHTDTCATGGSGRHPGECWEACGTVSLWPLKLHTWLLNHQRMLHKHTRQTHSPNAHTFDTHKRTHVHSYKRRRHWPTPRRGWQRSRQTAGC